MTYTIPLRQLSKNSIAAAGGKGANLGELTAAGMPVPAAFVLTTDAYNKFVATHSLQQQLITLADGVSALDPLSGDRASREIRQLFALASIPPDIVADLLRAYHDLGAAAVAVRSSATAEDLPDASFAGQQDTFLNIQGEDALLDAVKRCWAGLWTARAIAYRQRQEIAPQSVSLAVVVQQLIVADVSGVLFSANPVDGSRDQVVINATWGLGEALVGGQVTPDTIIVAKQTWEIVSRDTAAKRMMTVPVTNGTAEQSVPPQQQLQPALDDQTAVELARLGVQIEFHYGIPIDIEWALAEGEIVILQARPITSLPPEPLRNVTWEPVVPNTIWMRRQIVEHMPEPLSPLFEDLYLGRGLDASIKKLIDEMKAFSSAELHLSSFMPHGFAATINGYAYTTGSFRVSLSNVVAVLQIYSRIYRMFSLPAFDYDNAVLPGYHALIKSWDNIELAETNDETLLEAIAEMAAADSTYWFGSALNLGLSRTLDSLFDRFLRLPFVRHALPEPRPIGASFLRGFDSKALDAQADMESIAEIIRQSAELRELVSRTPTGRLISVLAAHPEGGPVSDAIDRYLDLYGHLIYNLDFAVPTQREDPEPLLLSLKVLVNKPPVQDVRTRQTALAAQREALVAETGAALNLLSRSLFRWIWKWTKRYAPYREEVMFYIGAAWPTVRKFAAELGRRLAAGGAIGQTDDIYYLTSREIERAIAERSAGRTLPDYAELVRERRDLRAARKRLAPPVKVPERASLKFGPLDLSMFDPTPGDVDDVGPILSGYAVSAGQVTAAASVIDSTDSFNQMKPGTVLVCTTTTPAWTPLFSQAVGLVTDVGGALAHGSIVAREYGIPAVMGTGNATDRIRSGQMIRVDGERGTVTLLEEVDESVELPPAPAGKEASSARTLGAAAALLVVGLMWWKRRG